MVTPRRNLVFCRAGEGSLHRAWLGDPATRSYDVWLDCYCDPARWAGEPAVVTDGRGATKWPRIAALLAERPEAFAPYDAIWFPDDDVHLAAGALEEFFSIFHRHRLSLAQPALADGCFWSHHITLENRSFVLRHVNVVEVMAPAFSRAALPVCASIFDATRFGLGLDFVWPRLLGDPAEGIAIVDATPMVHTRPVGASYDKVEAVEEMRALLARHGAAIEFRHRAGIARGKGGAEGRRVSGRAGLLARLLLGAPPSQRWRVPYWRFAARSVR